MLVKITLAEVEISQFQANEENYLIRIIDESKYQFDVINNSANADWLRSKGAKLEHVRFEDLNTLTLKEILYTLIDEKLATEYYLKF